MVFGGYGGFQLTEGYQAGAFLVATAIYPKKSMKTDEANLKREELASLVANWRAEFDLDASKLDDSQFTLFLEATGSSGYKELCDLKDDSKHLKESQADKTYNLNNLVSEQQQLALGKFEKALSAYLRSEFHWEENLLSDTGNLQGVELSPQTEGRTLSWISARR